METEIFGARRAATVGRVHRRERNVIVLIAASKGADMQLLGAQEERTPLAGQSMNDRIKESIRFV